MILPVGLNKGFVKEYALGLIGYPLGHSLSPKLHHAALEAAGLDGAYTLYPIPPSPLGREAGGEGGTSKLKDLLEKIRAGEIHGLNVTIPHKQTVIPYLNELTPTAQAIGAVNTIYFRDNKLTGDNTDAPGFLADLKKFLDGRRKTEDWQTPSPIPRPRSALVLGAGGSARAIVYALLQDGWHVTLAARRSEQAETLKSKIENRESKISILPLPFDKHDLRSSIFDLLINTTPLGMTPHIDTSPWPANLPFPENAAVYDLVYNPRETKLVRDARAAGLPATTGLGMLIEQAALAFEIWTGRGGMGEAMRKAMRET